MNRATVVLLIVLVFVFFAFALAQYMLPVPEFGSIGNTEYWYQLEIADRPNAQATKCERADAPASLRLAQPNAVPGKPILPSLPLHQNQFPPVCLPQFTT